MTDRVGAQHVHTLPLEVAISGFVSGFGARFVHALPALMTDFTSTAPSSSSVDVDAVNNQLSGLQIGGSQSSQSASIVNASSVPIEKRGVDISVFLAFVNAYTGKEFVCQND